jgi:hypothetical protein
VGGLEQRGVRDGPLVQRRVQRKQRRPHVLQRALFVSRISKGGIMRVMYVNCL